MAGMFELFVDEHSYFRFRLKAPDGTVMAVSRAFDDKPAAVAGIAEVREYAGMGLIADLCPASRSTPPVVASAGSVTQACEGQRVPVGEFRVRAKSLHTAAAGPRWTGAA